MFLNTDLEKNYNFGLDTELRPSEAQEGESELLQKYFLVQKVIYINVKI